MLSKIKNYIPIVVIVIVAAVLGVLTAQGVLDVPTLIERVRENRLLALCVIMALYVIKGVSCFFPVVAIIIGTSVVFDVYTSALITLIGNAMCVSLSYLMGRQSKELTLEKVLDKNPKLRKYFGNAKKYSFTFCFAVHTLHLSMELQGILFGLLRTPYLSYLGGTMLALFPSLMVFTVFGSDFDFKNPVFWVFIGMDALMVITGLIYAKRNIIDGGTKKNEKTD